MSTFQQWCQDTAKSFSEVQDYKMQLYHALISSSVPVQLQAIAQIGGGYARIIHVGSRCADYGMLSVSLQEMLMTCWRQSEIAGQPQPDLEKVVERLSFPPLARLAGEQLSGLVLGTAEDTVASYITRKFPREYVPRVLCYDYRKPSPFLTLDYGFVQETPPEQLWARVKEQVFPTVWRRCGRLVRNL